MMLFFRNDYGNGAHPAVLDALCKTNLELTAGYGVDAYSQNAAQRIRQLCGCPHADVHFIVGGTQANKTAIGAFLRSWEAVITADTGHIQVHEAGAVEHNGHRLMTVPTPDGKLCPEHINRLCEAYQQDETSPEPKLVYISNTTELGTVYTKAELQALRNACDQWGLYLYCDGARLAAAMAVSDTDLTHYGALCHAFTIGGTKNGLLFGEALVITEPLLMPSFRRCMKQQGAMLAKGRLLGVQFGAVLENDLYRQLGRQSTQTAQLLAKGMSQLGIPMLIDSPSNQLFPILRNTTIETLGQTVSFEHCIIVMTSNAGSHSKATSAGFNRSADELAEERTKKALSEFLRPEFLNRVDEIITFRPLPLSVFPEIVRLALQELADGLKEREVEFSCSDEAVEWLAEKSYSAEYGARNVRRIVQTEIEDRAVKILCETFDLPRGVSVTLRENELCVHVDLR